MATEPVQLSVVVGIIGASDDQVDLASRQLGDELRRQDFIEAAEPATGAVVSGTKSAELTALGALAVKAAAAALPTLVTLLSAWVKRREGRYIELEKRTPDGAVMKLKVTGAIDPQAFRAFVAGASARE